MARRQIGITLPTYSAPAAAVTTLDRTTSSISARSNGAGTILAVGPDIPADQRWIIEHATCACDSTTPTVLRLHAGIVNPGTLLDGSGAGNFDTGDWSPGLLVPAGSSLLAVWTGASNGSRGVLNFQVTILSVGRG